MTGRARAAVQRVGRAALAGTGHGHVRARAAIVRDQQRLAHHLWLAGAVAVGLPSLLRARPPSVDDLAAGLGADGTDRLDAWLRLGATLGEVQVRRGRVRITGARLAALADGDRLVTAWYQSLSTFGTAIPLGIGELVAGRADRLDATDEAPTIAALAELTDPMVHPAVAEALDATSARTLVDVGCGDGRLLAAALAHRPLTRAVGVDQAPAAIEAARDHLGSDRRVELLATTIEEAGDLGTFDVVTTANTSYYRPAKELPAFVERLTGLLAPGGALVVATAVAAAPDRSRGPVRPVAVASAILDLQLRCQPQHLRLPTAHEVLVAMEGTGLDHRASRWAAAGFPYVVAIGRRP